MKRTTRSDRELATALRAWGRTRLLVMAVEAQRNGFTCREEERHDAVPCWKAQEWTGSGEPSEPGEWCPDCRARQRWHLALTAIKRIHAARLRKLQGYSIAPAGDSDRAVLVKVMKRALLAIAYFIERLEQD